MEFILDSPINIVITKPVVSVSMTKYRYSLCNFILNQEMTIVIDYFTDGHCPKCQSFLKISGEEYNSWGSDDSYIQNIILTEIDNVRNGNMTNVIIQSV